MLELLVADDVVAENVEQEIPSAQDTRTSIDFEETIDTWVPGDVHTSPEVAEVIARLPWWAVRSVPYIMTAFLLVAFIWANFAKIDSVVVADGTVIPKGNIKPIQPASSGVVQNVFVKEGDKVELGDALIQLDAAEMRTRLEKLRQEMETSKSQLRLMTVDGPVLNTLEQQNRIARLQAEIGLVERMLRHTTITSPASGTITTLKVRGAGEILQEGQTIATIAPNDAPLVIEALLPNKDIAFVEKGLPAKLKFEAFPYQDFGVIEGTVIDVSPDALTNTNGASYYKVTIVPARPIISTSNKDVPLRRGLSVSAEIITERRSVISLLLEPVRRWKSEIAH